MSLSHLTRRKNRDQQTSKHTRIYEHVEDNITAIPSEEARKPPPAARHQYRGTVKSQQLLYNNHRSFEPTIS